MQVIGHPSIVNKHSKFSNVLHTQHEREKRLELVSQGNVFDNLTGMMALYHQKLLEQLLEELK